MHHGGTASLLLRITLLAAALSLAAYVPYKYATQLHAIEGSYAFLFPLSTILAVAGVLLAAAPQLALRAGRLVRGGIGSLALLWMATGILCVKTLTLAIIENPGPGLFATFHMLVQHVFLSLLLIVFALRPDRLASWLGSGSPVRVDARRGLNASVQ